MHYLNLIKKINSINIEFIFVVFALLFGLLLIFITPPIQVADEHNHFTKAKSYAEFKLFPIINNHQLGQYTKLGEHTDWIYTQNSKWSFDKYRELSTDKSKSIQFTNFTTMGLYSPIGYIPQTLGIIATQNHSDITQFYVARIFNLLFYILVGYMSIKIIPIMKSIVFLILLMPMSIALAASCSLDSNIIATSIIFLSLILAYKNIQLNKYQKSILFLLSIALGLMKCYFPLVFLILIIKDKSPYFKATTILSTIVITFGWSLINTKYVIPFNEFANPEYQMNYILHNPLEFIKIMITTSVDRLLKTYASFIGVLGWLKIRLPNIIYATYLPVILFLSIFSEKTLQTVNEKLICTIIPILSYTIILTSLFITWSDYRESAIIGIQGRYFIPLLLPLLLTLSTGKTFKANNLLIYTYSFVCLIMTANTVHQYFH